ncbi:unnamed protein product [Lupinus luteus]|uniref:Uncharacterized protein n=1 Tax=Lupinus luteus TaxID=3873 RepID=A0AAV1XSL2_LUPLU
MAKSSKSKIFIATRMRLTGTGSGGYMGLEPKQIAFEGDSDLFNEDKSCSTSLDFLGLANGCLAFWLLLVATSYLDLSKNLSFFCTCRSKTAEKVSLTVRTISNARRNNGATALNSHKCDAYSEISDFDRTSYVDALLSLEDDDTEWLSDIDSPSYWDSLLNLEEKDNDKEMYFDSLLSLEDDDNGWLSDSFENLSTSLSYKSDSLSEISYIDSPSYWSSLLKLEEKDNDEEMYFDSLLNLEDDDNGWLSDSFENHSTHFSYKSDFLCEISYIGSPSYWSSLLKLEEKDNDEEMYFDFLLSLEDDDNGWLSDSFENHSTHFSYKSDSLSEISYIGSPSYQTSLLKLEEKDINEPLFWPFEEGNFASNNDHSIETLLGLKEFDGHEGLDSEFNIFGDDFMLD